MENTIENKAKFFGQYAGQNIMRSGMWKSDVPNCPVRLIEAGTDWYIELRDLQSITADEAIEVAKIVYPSYNGNLITMGKSIISDLESDLCCGSTSWCKAINVYQDLQSLGFALPYHDLSVDDLIAYGWIKLTK